MPLASLSELLLSAQRGGYAVCYCESWDLGSFQAVVEAAEECDAPTIAGFNGGFLRHAGRSKPESLRFYAALRFALERSPVPVAMLLNESDDLVQMREAMELGFNAVMPENEGLTPGDYRALVADVVKIAHPRGVSVEAQLGTLPSGGSQDQHAGDTTEPEAAREFVTQTEVDALAVSVGNVHILTRGQAALDFDALRRIRKKVEVPLVVHGGTGLPPESIATLISLGVAKLNYGTVLKQVYLAALRESLPRYQSPMSPHPFLGMGGSQDILVAAREAVKTKVKELLVLSKSAGQARVA
jgi:ketose-bisphosphate aldolase